MAISRCCSTRALWSFFSASSRCSSDSLFQLFLQGLDLLLELAHFGLGALRSFCTPDFSS
jgi:hypothetical protein